MAPDHEGACSSHAGDASSSLAGRTEIVIDYLTGLLQAGHLLETTVVIRKATASLPFCFSSALQVLKPCCIRFW